MDVTKVDLNCSARVKLAYRRQYFDRSEIDGLFQTGMKRSEIAVRIGCNVKAVQRILSELGYEKGRKYKGSINE